MEVKTDCHCQLLLTPHGHIVITDAAGQLNELVFATKEGGIKILLMAQSALVVGVNFTALQMQIANSTVPAFAELNFFEASLIEKGKTIFGIKDDDARLINQMATAVLQDITTKSS